MVEDDPGHAVLIQKNLVRGSGSHTIVVAENGQKAVDYLLGAGAAHRAEGSAPEIILLDLNIPVLDGYQVLKAIKGDARTRTIPIVVLTTTDNPHEINRCYELGCNLYLTKPVEYEQFSETMRLLGAFIGLVKVPGKEATHG